MQLIFLNTNFRKPGVSCTNLQEHKSNLRFPRKADEEWKVHMQSSHKFSSQALLATAQPALSSPLPSTGQKPGKALLHAANTQHSSRPVELCMICHSDLFLLCPLSDAHSSHSGILWGERSVLQVQREMGKDRPAELGHHPWRGSKNM